MTAALQTEVHTQLPALCSQQKYTHNYLPFVLSKTCPVFIMINCFDTIFKTAQMHVTLNNLRLFYSLRKIPCYILFINNLQKIPKLI